MYSASANSRYLTMPTAIKLMLRAVTVAVNALGARRAIKWPTRRVISKISAEPSSLLCASADLASIISLPSRLPGRKRAQGRGEVEEEETR